MNKIFKRVVSLILCTIMLLCVFSSAGFAAQNDKNAAVYAEPIISGDTNYPKILDDDAIGYLPKFEDGDRVAFIGDSISFGTGSDGAYYLKHILSYYATRYPNVEFSYVNKAIGGDKIFNLVSRLEHDIFDFDYEKPFNKAVIMIGTNDMTRSAYFEGEENKPGAKEQRIERFEVYYEGLTKFVGLLKEKGLEQIILLSSPMFDQWLKYEEDDNGNPIGGYGYTSTKHSVNFNNVIREAGSVAYNVAKELNVDFIDVNTPQTMVTLYNRYEKSSTEDVGFTFVPDRIHPNEAGHYIITYAFLKAQGESGEVATVEIDATNNSLVKASNADVTDLAFADSSVKYTYEAKALPMGVDSAYRTAETYFPITDELNREIIKVTGLNEGTYDVKIDDSLVMKATAKQLAEGVNIADKKGNPAQQQALSVLGLAETRRQLDASYRKFIRNETSTIIPNYKLDATNNETLIASAKAWIESDIADANGVNELQQYIEYKQKEKETVEEINAFETEIYKINNPLKRVVVIEKSSLGQADSEINPIYVDYQLPDDTYKIKQRKEEKEITVVINEKPLITDVSPIIVDGRTLVPMRAIFEVFGAQIAWDEASSTATAQVEAKGEQMVIKLTENNKTVYINDDATELDVPAMIVDGRFLVPVRFVSETLGANVGWNSWAQRVKISAISLLDPDALAPISVTQSGDDGAGNDIENSFDRNFDTRWAPQGKDGAAWGIYDLGDVFEIEKVKIAYHNGKSRVYYFDIAVSEDGEEYKTVISGGQSSGNTNDFEEYDMKNVKARYIKYIGGGNSTNLWNSITEIMFYKKSK